MTKENKCKKFLQSVLIPNYFAAEVLAYVIHEEPQITLKLTKKKQRIKKGSNLL